MNCFCLVQRGASLFRSPACSTIQYRFRTKVAEPRPRLEHLSSALRNRAPTSCRPPSLEGFPIPLFSPCLFSDNYKSCVQLRRARVRTHYSLQYCSPFVPLPRGRMPYSSPLFPKILQIFPPSPPDKTCFLLLVLSPILFCVIFPVNRLPP